jgi:drug/metabolite transporter (DMT)-like permease
MTARTKGLLLAAGAAGISGVAVFINAYGVKAVPDATVYTTAKNLVAAVLLAALALLGARRTEQPAKPARPRRLAHLLPLAAIGVLGGSLPFVLFFEGLARASSTQSALLQKTLVIWVVILAVPLLGERLGIAHLAAIGLLVAGQATLAGGITGLHAGPGELLVLAATLLWAVETVLARRLLRDVTPGVLGVARMGLGTLVLLGWLAVTDRLGALAGLGRDGWWWALLTGAILASYVATWLRALALAPAVDVTAMLVPAAILTGLLNTAVKGTPLTAPAGIGMALLACGAVLVVLAQRRVIPAPAQARP